MCVHIYIYIYIYICICVHIYIYIYTYWWFPPRESSVTEFSTRDSWLFSVLVRKLGARSPTAARLPHLILWLWLLHYSTLTYIQLYTALLNYVMVWCVILYQYEGMAARWPAASLWFEAASSRAGSVESVYMYMYVCNCICTCILIIISSISIIIQLKLLVWLLVALVSLVLETPKGVPIRRALRDASRSVPRVTDSSRRPSAAAGYIYIYIYMCMTYIYIYVHIYIYIHIYIHTHTLIYVYIYIK